MSVSRTMARLIATCVASGALVGAAAIPALAAGPGHDRDHGRRYSHSHRGDDHDGRFGDHDRYRDRGWHHGWDHDRDRDRDRDRDWRGHHGWDRDRIGHPGSYDGRHADHDRYHGHR
ncbi:hypothetical protein OHB00_27430 [Streptomyces sp. NBC_00631]|uniref:hypothetical protein n=1 Tax=Streptomyces sp. NBC_00631 TaxID=2975793 RepID=UPI0030E01C2F